MMNAILIVLYIFSVIYIQCADSVVVYECYVIIYGFWELITTDGAVTNSWCEHKCATDGANYEYSGTISNRCYCRVTKPTFIDNTQLYTCDRKFDCPGNNNELCGGEYKKFLNWLERITVSKTGLSTGLKQTRTTSVSRRESTTTEFIRMITSDTSPLIVTQSTPDMKQELLSTTNENVVTATSIVMTETSTQTTTANGEWSRWNDWTFCEVNCVREDTTNGTQSRWRTCNGSKCSGKDVEERACSEPEICKGMRPRKLLCKCPKRLINTKWHFLDGMNITDAEMKKTVLEDFNKNIKSEISVDKKTVSKEIRKKNSSVDKRKSSQSIGWGCIVFLVLPMVFLMAIDILNCCIHFRSRFGDRKRNRIRPMSNTQDQRDITQPLQENVISAESNYASRSGNNFHPDEIKRETYQRRRDDNNQPGRDEWLQYI